MKEITGDLWHFHALGFPICITTNGARRKDGCAVMGRGCALQAAAKYPTFPRLLGDKLKDGGNIVHYFRAFNIFTFPVKHRWKESADLGLIAASTRALNDYIGSMNAILGLLPTDNERWSKIYLPRPGCGNGHQQWDTVRPILARVLDDRFHVVELPERM